MLHNLFILTLFLHYVKCEFRDRGKHEKRDHNNYIPGFGPNEIGDRNTIPYKIHQDALSY